MTKLLMPMSDFVLTDEMKSELLSDQEPAYLGVDIETTGLDEEVHHILSVALLFSDKHYRPIGKGIEIIIHQSEDILNLMDGWCWKTHTSSGLIDQVRESTCDLSEAEDQLINYIKSAYPSLQVGNERANLPMFGNSIFLDRSFIKKYMKTLLSCFHYRNVDVSTFKEVCRHEIPELYHNVDKSIAHTAMGDIIESFQEMAIYKEHMLK